MRLQEIIQFVADRTGENNSTQIGREVNNELRKLWNTSDIEGSLAEIDVMPNAERIISLPWYVFQVKAVKRAIGDNVRLYTPRAAFQDLAYAQTPFDIRVLDRSPLFQSLTNVGPLTLKLRKAATVAFSVTVRGPDDFGVDSVEDITFNPGEREHTTTGSYVDIKALSKSAQTSADVEVRDVNDEVVSIIPAGLTEVWCPRCQICDRNAVTTQQLCNTYTILFKKWPPFLSQDNDVIFDSLGIILQNAVAAARLSIRTDDAAMKQVENFKGEANQANKKAANQAAEGMTMKFDLRTSPWTSSYGGII